MAPRLSFLDTVNRPLGSAVLDANSVSQLDYDIAIVGGGIAGLTLATALRETGLKIVMLEAQPQATAIAKGQAYAIHLSSQRIWEQMGVWHHIQPWVQPFRRVRMSDGTGSPVVEFRPSDLKTEALGYVAEHQVLFAALLDIVQACPTVAWRCPVQVTAQRFLPSHAEVDFQAEGSPTLQTIRVGLVVGADGFSSPVRRNAQIKTRGKAYWQSCIVATVQPERSHQDIAYERFWPSGPFAILPLSATHCRIVWTVPHPEAQALLALDESAFMAQLTARYGSQMGRLTLASPRFAFPAKLMHACEYVRSRLALVGDAAHSCHPVGGQGLNLGIRDVGALAQVIQSAAARGEDIGSLKVLKRYQRWRRWENRLSLGFTDAINLLFSNNIFPLRLGRHLGLWLMSRIPPLKIAALRFMAGLSGKLPRPSYRSMAVDPSTLP